MSISFEELADSELTPGQIHGTDDTSTKGWVLPFILVVVMGAIGLWLFLGREQLPELNETAERLLVSEEEAEATGALPHVVDDKTEFSDSITYLKEGIRAPEVREVARPSLSSGAVVHEELPTVMKQEPTLSVESSVVAEQAEIVVEVPVAELAAPVLETAEVEEVVVVAPTVIEMGLLAQRDWGGVVLVPDNVRLSRAFSSAVRLDRIEAHPIDGDRLRVWVRIQNITDRDLDIKVGCDFRSTSDRSAGSDFQVVSIPGGYARDIHFVSAGDFVKAYTLLVKRLN